MWSNKPWLKLGNILGYLARLIFPNQSNPFGQYDKSLRLNLNSRWRAYINCNRGRNMIFYIISTDKYPCIFFSVRWKLLLTYCKFKIMCPVVQSSFVLCSLFASWNKHYVHKTTISLVNTCIVLIMIMMNSLCWASDIWNN